jgi:hypothetical protein
MTFVLCFFLGYTAGLIVQHWASYTDWETALKKFNAEKSVN